MIEDLLDAGYEIEFKGNARSVPIAQRWEVRVFKSGTLEWEATRESLNLAIQAVTGWWELRRQSDG